MLQPHIPQPNLQRKVLKWTHTLILTIFRIPDSFRDLWLRDKGLTWKNVKNTFICSLHFESKHFRGKKLDLKSAQPTINIGTSQSTNEHEYTAVQSTNYISISATSDINKKLISSIEKLKKENLRLKKQNKRLRSEATYYKRKFESTQSLLEELSEKLKGKSSKFGLSKEALKMLEKCASEVPKQLFEATANKVSGSGVRMYDTAIKKFSLSLHLCSNKAYR